MIEWVAASRGGGLVRPAGNERRDSDGARSDLAGPARRHHGPRAPAPGPHLSLRRARERERPGARPPAPHPRQPRLGAAQLEQQPRQPAPRRRGARDQGGPAAQARRRRHPGRSEQRRTRPKPARPRPNRARDWAQRRHGRRLLRRRRAPAGHGLAQRGRSRRGNGPRRDRGRSGHPGARRHHRRARLLVAAHPQRAESVARRRSCATAHRSRNHYSHRPRRPLADRDHGLPRRSGSGSLPRDPRSHGPHRAPDGDHDRARSTRLLHRLRHLRPGDVGLSLQPLRSPERRAARGPADGTDHGRLPRSTPGLARRRLQASAERVRRVRLRAHPLHRRAPPHAPQGHDRRAPARDLGREPGPRAATGVGALPGKDSPRGASRRSGGGRRPGRAHHRPAALPPRHPGHGLRARARGSGGLPCIDLPCADPGPSGGVRHHRFPALGGTEVPALSVPRLEGRKDCGVRPRPTRGRHTAPLPPAMRAVQAHPAPARAALEHAGSRLELRMGSHGHRAGRGRG